MGGTERKRARQGGKEEGVGGERRLIGGIGVTGTDSLKEMEMERERQMHRGTKGREGGRE